MTFISLLTTLAYDLLVTKNTPAPENLTQSEKLQKKPR
jgi:hypothetical protein